MRPTPGSPAARLFAVVELARPGNVVMAGAGAVIGAVVAAGPGAWDLIGLAAAATGLVTAGGNALNDVVDRAIDRQAHPERPIASGRVSPTAGGVVAGLAFALALLAAALISVPVLALVAGAEAMLLAYELVFKARGLVGNLVVATLVAATFLGGALAVGRVTAPVGFLSGMALTANVGREVYKDAEDAAHDRGRETLAQRWGPERASRLADASLIGAVALSVSPLIVGFGGPLFWAGIAIADVAFLAAVLAGSPASAQRRAKAAMVVALAAFAAGGLA